MIAAPASRGGATALPLPVMLATIPSLPRPVLSRLVARMIERLDEMDGDPDRELNGDELDGALGEDDFHDQNANWLGYPGDPDDAEDGGDLEADEAPRLTVPRYGTDQRVVFYAVNRGMGLDVDTMRDRRV